MIKKSVETKVTTKNKTDAITSGTKLDKSPLFTKLSITYFVIFGCTISRPPVNPPIIIPPTNRNLKNPNSFKIFFQIPVLNFSLFLFDVVNSSINVSPLFVFIFFVHQCRLFFEFHKYVCTIRFLE